MVSIALIALFSTLALPLHEMTVKRSKEAELHASLRQIRDALDAYKQAVDEGRVGRETGDSGYPRTLATLVTGVPDLRRPDGNPVYFLRRVPRDPFAPTNLKPEETWGLRSYQSSYDQPQPGADVYDVYSLSSGVGLNGIPYRQW